MGDSLYYNKDLGYGKALRNVKLTDTIKKINIYGELGEYFENKEEIEIKNKPPAHGSIFGKIILPTEPRKNIVE